MTTIRRVAIVLVWIVFMTVFAARNTSDMPPVVGMVEPGSPGEQAGLMAGDRVLAVGRVRTRGKASGVDTEAPVGYVADFRDGKFVRVRTYLAPDEALEAAGLRE